MPQTHDYHFWLFSSQYSSRTRERVEQRLSSASDEMKTYDEIDYDRKEAKAENSIGSDKTSCPPKPNAAKPSENDEDDLRVVDLDSSAVSLRHCIEFQA